MRGHAFSDEERTDAIRLVAEHGLGQAWRETGIPKPTLVRWCIAAGVERFHPERTRAAVDALQERASVVREHLRAELLERAVDLLERMDEPHVEFKGKDADQVEYPVAPASAVQNYATSAAILIDKYRLEMGEATGRSENVSVTDGLPADARRALRERFAEYARDVARGDGADRAGRGDGVAVTGEGPTATAD